MGKGKDNKGITAIVPAYNEAERIGRVLDVLTGYPGFTEIIVVDDGSTDGTHEVVGQYGVHYARNLANRGKGYSMDVGVKLAKGDIIFFADADISGLTHRIIDEITKPVLDGELEMFIAMRNRKIYFLRHIIDFVPLLGGERALTKDLWEKLPNYYKYHFRVEPGLNFYAKYYGKGFKFNVFKGLSQVTKEKKYGFLQGTGHRWKLISSIVSAQLRLRFFDIPTVIRNRRVVLVRSLQSLSGVILGVLISVSAYIGPEDFIHRIVVEGSREDPNSPLARFLLYLVNITDVGLIAVIGISLVIASVIVFSLNLRRLALSLKRSVSVDTSDTSQYN